MFVLFVENKKKCNPFERDNDAGGVLCTATAGIGHYYIVLIISDEPTESGLSPLVNMAGFVNICIPLSA